MKKCDKTNEAVFESVVRTIPYSAQADQFDTTNSSKRICASRTPTQVELSVRV